VTSRGQDNRLSSDADILVRSRTTTPIPSSPTPYVTRSLSTSMPDDAPPPKVPDTPKSQRLEIDQSPKPTQSPSLSPQTNAKRTSDSSNLDSKSNDVVVKDGAYRPASASAQQKASSTRICGKCQRPLTGQFVRALANTYHLGCFSCQVCRMSTQLTYLPLRAFANLKLRTVAKSWRRNSFLPENCQMNIRYARLTTSRGWLSSVMTAVAL
jgi:hypothetical protein